MGNGENGDVADRARGERRKRTERRRKRIN